MATSLSPGPVLAGAWLGVCGLWQSGVGHIRAWPFGTGRLLPIPLLALVTSGAVRSRGHSCVTHTDGREGAVSPLWWVQIECRAVRMCWDLSKLIFT